MPLVASDAEQAVRRYVELVPGSRIEHVPRSPGPWPGGKAGDAIVIDFTRRELGRVHRPG